MHYQDGSTALHWISIQNGLVGLIKLLVDRGANIETRDKLVMYILSLN